MAVGDSVKAASHLQAVKLLLLVEDGEECLAGVRHVRYRHILSMKVVVFSKN